MSTVFYWLERNAFVTIAILAMGFFTLSVYMGLVVYATFRIFGPTAPVIDSGTAIAYGALLGGPTLAASILGAMHSKWMTRLSHKEGEK